MSRSGAFIGSQWRSRRWFRRTSLVVGTVLLVGAVLWVFSFVQRANRRSFDLENNLRLAALELDDLYNFVTQLPSENRIAADSEILIRLVRYHDKLAKTSSQSSKPMPLVAESYRRLGRLYRQSDDVDSAIVAFELAIAVYMRLSHSPQNSSIYAAPLADCRIRLAAVMLELERFSEAESLLHLTRRAFVEVTSAPTLETCDALATHDRCMTVIAAHSKDLEEAESWARSAVEVIQRQCESAPPSVDQIRNLGDASHVHIHLLRQLWRVRDAEIVCRNATDLIKKAILRDPINRTLRNELAAMVAVLNELQEPDDGASPSDTAPHDLDKDESLQSLARGVAARRIISPFVSAEKLLDAVVHRSVMKLPLGDCILLNMRPLLEGRSLETIENWDVWLAGDPNSDDDNGYIYCDPEDPLSMRDRFDARDAGVFNCHTFSFGLYIGLNRGDWLVGRADSRANYTNPLQVVLDSHFEKIKVLRFGPLLPLEFENDSDLQNGDVVCFGNSHSESEYSHSGRIHKINGQNRILSKIGQEPVVLATMKQMTMMYDGFDEVSVFRFQSHSGNELLP